MTDNRVSAHRTAFAHGSTADWIADEISAIEEMTRGRFRLTSYYLICALDALASEATATAQAERAGERKAPASVRRKSGKRA
jgi:hypothetical protein